MSSSLPLLRPVVPRIEEVSVGPAKTHTLARRAVDISRLECRRRFLSTAGRTLLGAKGVERTLSWKEGGGPSGAFEARKEEFAEGAWNEDHFINRTDAIYRFISE